MAGPERGWQVGLTLSQCMLYRLENQLDCDVTFKFTSPLGSCLRAHKYMLTSRSPVFEAMLSGNFVDSNKDIEVMDIDGETFKEMLRYIYTDEPNITADNVIHLMQVARKYIIESLSAKCVTFLSTQITDQNVCTILTDCLANREDSVVDDCIKFIGPILDIVIASDGFVNLSQEALYAILNADEIEAVSESALLEACLWWARENTLGPPSYISGSVIREQLGPCLKQIRFWDIPPAEFPNMVARVPGLLDHDELSHIYGYMLSQNDFNKETLLQMGFNFEPRKQKQRYTFMRFDKINLARQPLQCRGQEQEEHLGFQTSTKAKLIGIGLYGGNKGDTPTIKLSLYESDIMDQRHDEEIACINQTSTSNQNVGIISVMFDSPLSVKPANIYTATVKLCGQRLYYGTYGRDVINAISETATVETHIVLKLSKNYSATAKSIRDAKLKRKYGYTDDLQSGHIAEFYFAN